MAKIFGTTLRRLKGPVKRVRPLAQAVNFGRSARGSPRRQIMPAIEHRSHKGLNNRAENSHLPLRRRERAMQGFRSPAGLQRFVAVFSVVRNLFVPPRSRRSALATHLHRLNAVAQWKAVAGIAA